MAGGKFYRINQYIKAEKVRVVDKEGRQIGIITITEALEEAKRRGLDLVEVASKAVPPVCKIIDFKKFKYQEKKKRRNNGKRKKQPELKQIKLGLFIDGHDLERIINRAEKFLKGGDRVKFNILLRGREATKKNFGFDLFEKIKAGLKEAAKVARKPELKGKILEMTLEPK